MLLSKVLVPLDGSQLSGRILIHVGRLLHAKGATVALLRVVPGVEEVATTAKVLDDLRDGLAARGVPATARVLVGDPAGKIAEIAAETGVSLIALSTHGRSGIPRVTLGSVAEEVLRLSPVPVLVANPFALRETEELPIRKILVALDGSTRSAKAIPPACEIARLHGAELVLFHALDLSWSHYPEVARPHERASVGAILDRELESLDVRASARVVEGSPAEKILEAVETEKADLLAIASHGRSGLARWYHGSVAEPVVRRCPCPVLVVRCAENVAPRPREDSRPA